MRCFETLSLNFASSNGCEAIFGQVDCDRLILDTSCGDACIGLEASEEEVGEVGEDLRGWIEMVAVCRAEVTRTRI